MKHQPNRLTQANHHLGGYAIDRSIPLRFRLDGRQVHGFAGDTVLSALLASGVDIAGLRGGQPMALNARFAPTVAPAALVRDLRNALPMERTPAIHGMDLRTLAGPANSLPLIGPLLRPARSLGIDLDKPMALVRPWLDQPAQQIVDVDVVVVGAGLAGLSAALAAGEAGQDVVLLEASPMHGGMARLFGTVEGEEAPNQAVERLLASIADNPRIRLIGSAEAFAARPGLVRAHLVIQKGNEAVGQVVDYRAAAIVLATGTLERLPLFAGNRQPGIVGVAEAFERADRYGVFVGRTALLATSSSLAYRLAMLAGDAGIAITKILDARSNPQSRFVEFAKAYGFTQSPGTVALEADWLGPKKGLSVALQSAFEELATTDDPPRIAAETLLVSGGWQPDLTLWHMTGGQSQWSAASSRIEPAKGPNGIALAGSAAGWISNHACLDSGQAAIAIVLGQTRATVTEQLIDPIYETPDGPAPLSTLPPVEHATTYLDFGASLIARPVPPAPSWRRFIPFSPGPRPWSLADQPQALGVCDVAAGVQLGAIPAASAGIVAAERSAFNGNLIDAATADRPDPAPTPPLLPPYLAGRFGTDATVILIAPDEPRQIEPGTLIFANDDDTDPRKAIGVALGSENGMAIALMAKRHNGASNRAVLRDQGRPVPIGLGEAYDAPLGAPLGGNTSPL